MISRFRNIKIVFGIFITYAVVSTLYTIATGDVLTSDVHVNTFGRIMCGLALLLLPLIFWVTRFPNRKDDDR